MRARTSESSKHLAGKAFDTLKQPATRNIDTGIHRDPFGAFVFPHKFLHIRVQRFGILVAKSLS